MFLSVWFVYNWNTDINDSTRARCYILYADFRFQPYLNWINIDKTRVALSLLRVSAYRLEIETGRLHRPLADLSMKENVEPV